MLVFAMVCLLVSGLFYMMSIKPDETPIDELVEMPVAQFQAVPVTHFPEMALKGVSVDQMRKDFEVWRDNNRLLFG